MEQGIDSKKECKDADRQGNRTQKEAKIALANPVHAGGNPADNQDGCSVDNSGFHSVPAASVQDLSIGIYGGDNQSEHKGYDGSEKHAYHAVTIHRKDGHDQVDCCFPCRVPLGPLKVSRNTSCCNGNHLKSVENFHQKKGDCKGIRDIIGIRTSSVQRQKGGNQSISDNHHCRGKADIKGFVYVDDCAIIRLALIKGLTENKLNIGIDAADDVIYKVENHVVDAVDTHRCQIAEDCEEHHVGTICDQSADFMNERRVSPLQRVKIGFVLQVKPGVVFTHIAVDKHHLYQACAAVHKLNKHNIQLH